MDWQAVTLHFDELRDADEAERAAMLAMLGEEQPQLVTMLRTLFDHADAADAGPSDEAEALVTEGGLVGPWRIEALLGKGGMGEVYRARRDDGVYDQVAALKLIRDGNTRGGASFVAERQRLARLEHPGIARIIDGGVDDAGRLYMAMEFVDGAPLDRWCEERGCDRRARISLARQLCAAIAHAHARLVLHRDIKPANVLVTSDGQLRLIDFGIATLLDEEADHGLGGLTLAVAAPEQLDGGDISTATDIFQAGMVIHQLLVGRFPERQPDGSVKVDGEALGDSDLAAVLGSATAATPEDRYASIDAFDDDLERYLDGMPVAAREGGAGYRMGKFLRRNALASTLGLLAVVGLASATVVSLIAAQRAEAARQEIAEQLEVARFSQEEAMATSDSAGAMRELFNQLTAEVAGLDEQQVREFLVRQADRLVGELEDSPEATGAALNGIANFLMVKGDYESAERISRAVAHADNMPEIPRITALMMQGRTLKELGRNADSAAALREVLDWMEQRQFLYESDGYADTLKNYALYSGDRAALPEALSRITEIATREEEDAGYRSYMFNEASALAQRSGDFELAMRLQEQAVELAQDNAAGNPFSLSTRSLNLVNLILHATGDTERARSHFPPDDIVFGEARGTIRAASYYRWLQSVALQIDGDVQGALARAREAHRLAVSDLGENDVLRLAIAANVVEAAALAGEPALARQYLDEARRGANTDEGAARVVLVEAALALAEGRDDDAGELATRAGTMQDAIGGRAELAFKYQRLQDLLAAR